MAVCGGEPPPSASIGLAFMSCVKNQPQDNPPIPSHDKSCVGEGKKKGFHPLRGLRRIFRRRQKTSDAKSRHNPVVEPRTRSASQLLNQPDNGVHSGLSVSHDSVFSPQHSAVSSTLSIHQLPHHTATAELLDVVNRRRDQEINSDEEDMGLPTSPVNHSPTTVDVLLEHPMKDTINKSTHSTCSDGSLLSMSSSEMDEDSRTSSKLSLYEKKSNISKDTLDDFALAGSGVICLSHSAAKHKMAVRPKRKHATSRHRNHLVSLPVTPELNEESLMVVTTVQGSQESTIIIKDTHSKSASLPTGVTPCGAWGLASCDGFFSRLLARRSGKKKKNVELRQRIQPRTINAPNVSKSQSFRQEPKLPIVCLDPPSLPNIEATFIWVSQDDTCTKSNTIGTTQPEIKQICVSKEITNELILENDTLDTYDEVNNTLCNQTSKNVTDTNYNQLDICNKSKETVITENECNNTLLQKCSVVSTIHDSIHVNSPKVETKLHVNILTEETKLFNEMYSKCDSLLNSIGIDNVFVENQNDIDNESNSIKVNENAKSASGNSEFENESSYSSKPNKNEHCKFEIKSITDGMKISDLILSDKNLSLSELSSAFEDTNIELTNIVARQKSFSLGKQSTTVCVKDSALLRKFEEVSKVDVKTNIDVKNHETMGIIPDNESPSKYVFSIEAKNYNKLSEKQFDKKLESGDSFKSSHSLSETDVIIRRRSSREVLKPKEEEPELLKVFARRSLKVKDVEEDVPAKSRDSDKENDDCVTERKKIEYQRSVSSEDCILSIHNICRQRSKTLPELSQHKPLNIYKDVESLNIEKNDINEEPTFIRIQQRKEEWEKRVQQAMGK